MKNRILLLVALFIGFSYASQAQDVNVVAGSANYKVEAWGTSADTLTASVAKTIDISVKGIDVAYASLTIKTDSISGTPAYTAVLYKGYDGEGWIAIDTITHTGGLDKYAAFTDFYTTNTRYKVVITATGAAQKSNLFLYGVFRK